MTRRNEFKTPTTEFESLSDALTALDDLINDVNSRKRDSEGKCESTRVYRSHVGGLKQCIESVIESSLESWRSLGLDRSFCQKSEKLTKSEYRCVMLFMHPVYEQVWISDPEGKNVAEEYIPFLEFDLEYIKETKKLAIGRAVLEKKVHLPELSASYSATQGDLDIIKNETLRVEAIHKAAFAAEEKLIQEIGKYCGEHRLDFDGAAYKGKDQKTASEKESASVSEESGDEKPDDKEKGLKASDKEEADDGLGGDDVLEFIDDDVDEEITDVTAGELEDGTSETDDKKDGDTTLVMADPDYVEKLESDDKSDKKNKKSSKGSSSKSSKYSSKGSKSPLISPMRPSTQPLAKN